MPVPRTATVLGTVASVTKLRLLCFLIHTKGLRAARRPSRITLKVVAAVLLKLLLRWLPLLCRRGNCGASLAVGSA